MLKKRIEYLNPFTDQMVVEEHYFHLSKATLIEMEMEEHKDEYTAKDGETYTGLQAHLKRIADSDEPKAVLSEFKAIISRAYGKKVGDKFVQGESVWKEFEGTEAYSEFVFALFTDPAAMAEFVNNIVPGNLEEIAKEVNARADAEEASPTLTQGSTASTPAEPQSDPTGLTNETVTQVLSKEQIKTMDPAELQAGLADGRYSLT